MLTCQDIDKLMISNMFLPDFVRSSSKVTTEAQLGLIGGTMGLLTGFSILSGVEIIYYFLRYFNLMPFISEMIEPIL